VCLNLKYPNKLYIVTRLEFPFTLKVVHNIAKRGNEHKIQFQIVVRIRLRPRIRKE
jgi:hypothetical protein